MKERDGSPTHLHQVLSRRQRQVVDAVYALHEAGVQDVRNLLPSPPSYSAVRATLDVLAGRGILLRRKQGRRFLYAPRVPRRQAQKELLGRILEAYFGGSVPDAVSALISVGRTRLRSSDFDELMTLISKARKRKESKNDGSHRPPP